MEFVLDHPKLNDAVDYILKNHTEIFSTTIPNLLTDANLIRKYDTNIYTLLVNWNGKQEDSGRDYLYKVKGGDPDDITFTVECKNQNQNQSQFQNLN